MPQHRRLIANWSAPAGAVGRHRRRRRRGPPPQDVIRVGPPPLPQACARAAFSASLSVRWLVFRVLIRMIWALAWVPQEATVHDASHTSRFLYMAVRTRRSAYAESGRRSTRGPGPSTRQISLRLRVASASPTSAPRATDRRVVAAAADRANIPTAVAGYTRADACTAARRGAFRAAGVCTSEAACCSIYFV